MPIQKGSKVHFNGLAPRAFRSTETYVVDEVITVAKGTIKGLSLGVRNLCKRKDIQVVRVVNHPKYHTPYPIRFLSIVK